TLGAQRQNARAAVLGSGRKRDHAARGGATGSLLRGRQGGDLQREQAHALRRDARTHLVDLSLHPLVRQAGVEGSVEVHPSADDDVPDGRVELAVDEAVAVLLVRVPGVRPALTRNRPRFAGGTVVPLRLLIAEVIGGQLLGAGRGERLYHVEVA